MCVSVFLSRGLIMAEILQLDKYTLGSESTGTFKSHSMEREDILSHIQTAVEDFGKAFVSSSLERPVNGLVQIGNRTVGTDWLPELRIVGAPTHKGLATDIGTLAGTAVDYVLLSKAMGPVYNKIGIPKIGLLGDVSRAALSGALLEGVFTPSAGNGNFFVDRFSNGIAGGAAFGSMSLIGAGLHKTGLFKPTFAGEVALGASAGFLGGAAYAQVDSLVEKGRPASVADTISLGLSYAGTGAVLGGLGRGFQGLSGRFGTPSVLVPELRISK
jgi:hypothetical protein